MVSEHASSLHSVARQCVRRFSLYGTGTRVPHLTLCCGTVLFVLPGTHPVLWDRALHPTWHSSVAVGLCSSSYLALIRCCGTVLFVLPGTHPLLWDRALRPTWHSSVAVGPCSSSYLALIRCCGTVLFVLPGTHPLLCPQQLPQLPYAGAPRILRRLQLHLKPPRLRLLVLLDKRQLQQFHVTQAAWKPPIFARSSSSVPTTAVEIYVSLQTSWLDQ